MENQQARQLDQLFRSIAQHHATARVDHRALGSSSSICTARFNYIAALTTAV
jgi:hypothetical protein